MRHRSKRLLDRFVDRFLDRFLDRTVSSQDEPLATFLEMSGISKRFGGVHALRNVDLTLEVGEVHCIVGETVPASRHSLRSFPASRSRKEAVGSPFPARNTQN